MNYICQEPYSSLASIRHDGSALDLGVSGRVVEMDCDTGNIHAGIVEVEEEGSVLFKAGYIVINGNISKETRDSIHVKFKSFDLLHKAGIVTWS